MESSSRASVFVIDDHELIRRGLRHLINATPDMQVCCEAASAAEAVERLTEARRPDVAILDLSLPDGNGIELIKRMNARYPEIRLLVSSMHDEELFAERCLTAGASGYINKQEAAEQVLAAVRQVLGGKVYLSRRMTERLSRKPPDNSHRNAVSVVDRLSDRELSVYELIGKGIRTADIAQSLHLSIKTIETYRASIKRKLRLESSAALTRSAVQWALERG